MKTVPKRIFFYWGNKEMSWLRYMTLYSFRKFNPDWEIELHVSDVKNLTRGWKGPIIQDFHTYETQEKNWLPEVEKLGVKIKECPVLAEEATPIQNSDIFRWNELATNGGFYSDMDILFIKPIEEYYQQVKNFETGISYHTGKKRRQRFANFNGYFSIGFMFSAGNNRFFRDIFESSKTGDLINYQNAGVHAIYRMLGSTEGIAEYRDGMHLIPMKVVYPYRSNQQRQFFAIADNRQIHGSVTIGIHWYAGNKAAQAFNNAVNPDTLNNFNNTMSYWLKRVWD
jgi:hypothetical protein